MKLNTRRSRAALVRCVAALSIGIGRVGALDAQASRPAGSVVVTPTSLLHFNFALRPRESVVLGRVVTALQAMPGVADRTGPLDFTRLGADPRRYAYVIRVPVAKPAPGALVFLVRADSGRPVLVAQALGAADSAFALRSAERDYDGDGLADAVFCTGSRARIVGLRGGRAHPVAITRDRERAACATR